MLIEQTLIYDDDTLDMVAEIAAGSRQAILIRVLAIGAGIGAAISEILAPEEGMMPTMIGISAVLILFGIVGLPWFLRNNTRKNAAALRGTAAVYRFDNRGIHIDAEKYHSFYLWSTISRTLEKGDWLCIVTDDNKAILVKKSGLTSEELDWLSGRCRGK